MKSTFAEIQFNVDSLAVKINVAPDLFPTYGYSRDGGFPHIEIDNDGTVYFVIVERGHEFERWAPPTMDDLLYRIFKDATWSMAGDYELKHRIKGQDFRRINFAEHERLLSLVNKEWQIRLQKHHQDVLIKHPFDDNGSKG